jgi:Tfp pilus assembly protein PilZ/CheY-like chemotaxis protein
MKRLLVGDHRAKLLETIELIVKHWGYRLVASTRAEPLIEFLQTSAADLLILGPSLLGSADSALGRLVERQIREEHCPVIVLGEAGIADPLQEPHDYLEAPIDIFDLFALVQRHLEQFPRKNLRLAVRLPGLIRSGKASHLADVLSLSREGLFIKSGFLLEQGAEVTIGLSLIGMKKELQLAGRVLYRVHPAPENNYLQGLGIAFEPSDNPDQRALEAFIEHRFLEEVAARQGAVPVDTEQIKRHDPQPPKPAPSD